MNKEEEKENLVLQDLVKRLNDANLTHKELLKVVTDLLYSVGASVEKCKDLSNEEVLKIYGEKPTLGIALMAQALWMRDTWVVQ